MFVQLSTWRFFYYPAKCYQFVRGNRLTSFNFWKHELRVISPHENL